MRHESGQLGRCAQRRRHIVILKLDGSIATGADQELRCMVMSLPIAMTIGFLGSRRMYAADKRRQPLDLVHESLGEQKIERAIHRRWCGTFVRRP